MLSRFLVTFKSTLLAIVFLGNFSYCQGEETVSFSSAPPNQVDSSCPDSLVNVSEQMEVNCERAHQIVDDVNSKMNLQWTAVIHHRFAPMTQAELKRLLGSQKKVQGELESSKSKSKPNSKEKLNSKEKSTDVSQKRRKRNSIPMSFDVRKNWTNCANFVSIIRDQSACGGCWAVATGSMITDRLCIRQQMLGESPYDSPFLVSEADILSCSGAGNCSGGVVQSAIQWVVQNRVVSGSNYTYKAFCMPFALPPSPTTGTHYDAPQCARSCTNRIYKRKYNADKIILGSKGFRAGHLEGPGLEQQIQQEIMTKGSVVASLNVYEDFFHYSTGIYKQTSGNLLGGHAIRIIGWGQAPANGTVQPYWLCANSWNTDWGENGFFRIIRGRDECQIESFSIDYLYITATDV